MQFNSKQSSVIHATIGTLLLGAVSIVGADVLVVDGFGDADRDNDAVTDGSASVTDAGDVGVPWYMGRGTSGFTLGVEDDTAGIGADNALDVLVSNDSTRPVVGSFTPATIANDGDRIVFAFTVRVTESPIDVTDGGTFPTASDDRTFRFGIYNSNGTPVTADTGDSAITGNDTGYVAQIDIGVGAGTTYAAVGDKADGILGGSAVALGASGVDPAHFIENTPHTLQMILTRSGQDVNVGIYFDGALAQSGTAAEADITTFGLPYSFDYVAFGTSNASIDYRIDNVTVEFVAAPESTPTEDGFEDGDRDNDGAPEGPVNDIGDLGLTWYLARGTSDVTVTVEDDSAGIGTLNAMGQLSATTSTRCLAAAIEEITLAEIGDQARFAFDVRLRNTIPVSDLRFRWGLYNDGGTPVTTDGSSESGDDYGYTVMQDTGAPSDSDVLSIRGDRADGLLSGSFRSTGATTGDPQWAMTDTNVHRFELRARRAYDTDLGRDVVALTAIIDGEVADEGVDEGENAMDTDPLTYVFNQVVIGTNSASGIDMLIDNVEVGFIPATPPGPVNSDGFEDGDRDNNGAPEGPINDVSDFGYTWFLSRNSSDPTLDIINDAVIGTQNALNFFTLSSSLRPISAAIEPVSLDQPGDSVSLEFDIRLVGSIPSAGYGIRFGIHDSQGTPVSSDGPGTAATNDDLGYTSYIDTGASAVSTVTVRGDNDPTSFMGGSVRALGGTSDDPAYALDDNDAHNVELVVTRRYDETLLRDVNDVEIYFDGVLAIAGVDSGDNEMPQIDTNPVTYSFDQISIGSSVAFVEYNIDNVTVTKSIAPPPMCIGDLDGDNDTDVFDFNIFAPAFGSTGLPPFTGGDLDGDGDVDVFDFNIFAPDFGCPN